MSCCYRAIRQYCGTTTPDNARCNDIRVWPTYYLALLLREEATGPSEEPEWNRTTATKVSTQIDTHLSFHHVTNEPYLTAEDRDVSLPFPQRRVGRNSESTGLIEIIAARHSLQNWYQVSPANYLFAVKAPRLITHYKQFNGVGGLLTDFYGTLQDGLREKLGPVLFQLPQGMSHRLEFEGQAFELPIGSMDLPAEGIQLSCDVYELDP